jgi:translation initiation factor IF-2
LLDYLRKMHGGGAETGKTKITITRKQTGEIRKTDSTGKSRTIQVEVRKSRTYVKRDTSALAAEAQPAAEPAAEAKPAPQPAELAPPAVEHKAETPAPQPAVEPIETKPVEVEPVVEPAESRRSSAPKRRPRRPKRQRNLPPKPRW